MSHGPVIVAALAGYVLGSLPFGYLVGRACGVDIFKVGSGNPGATNVKRVVGAKAGHTVFALDVLKGALAAGWPLILVGGAEARLAGIAGLIAAVLGHSYSVFTRFRGGKGVSTAAGGLVVLMPPACLVAAVVWVVVFYAFRYVSLASIAAAAAVAVASWLTVHSLPLNLLATAIAVFVIVRHRTNLRRLLQGTENKFARKPKETETQ